MAGPSQTPKVLETNRVILVIPSYFALFWKGFEFFILSWQYSYSVKFYSLRSWCMKRNLYRRVVVQLNLYWKGVKDKETSKWTKPKASCLWKRNNMGMEYDMPEARKLVQMIYAHVLCCFGKFRVWSEKLHWRKGN